MSHGDRRLYNNHNSQVNWHYTDQGLDRTAMMIRVNCLSLALLAHAMLPSMVTRAAREGQRSAIITLGALNAQIPLPAHSLSSATKHFVRGFTLAVGKTMDAHVDVMCAHPLAVSSEILRTGSDGVWIISPRRFAAGLLRHLGHSRETFGYWLHEALHECVLRAPMCVQLWSWELTTHNASFLKRDLQPRSLLEKMLLQK